MVTPSFPNARRFARRPVLFASIQIGDEAQGLILNGSEGGICVHVAAGTVAQGPVDLRFQSAKKGNPTAWVKCRGRIVWTSRDQIVAGIEFVDPTPETNREIGNWLSFGESLRELRRDWPTDQTSQVHHWADDVSEREASLLSHASTVEPSPQNVAPAENPAQQGEREPFRQWFAAFGQNYEDAKPARARIWLAAAATAIIVIVGAAMLMKLHIRGWNLRNLASNIAGVNQSREADHPTATSATNAGSSAARTVEPPPANALAAGSAPSAVPAPYDKTSTAANALVNSGLMLQAGAMTGEQNAKEMAQSLQQKHFPAFVYKKEGDRFYRVFVGPYANDQSLRQAQATLRSMNIPTIKKNGP